MKNLFNLECVFKGVSKRDGGEFTNDKNVVVKYDPAYVIKLDEQLETGDVVERRLKFPITNKTLYNKLSELDVYSKITLVCKVELYNGNAKVLPIDIEE